MMSLPALLQYFLPTLSTTIPGAQKNDKLLQRMGELRHNENEQKGAWFRMNGSKIGRSGKFGFENKYTAYELGYDTLTKNTAKVKRYQGAAFSYTDGSSSYNSGSGDNSGKAISFYNTEIGSKGHYLDVVFKISNMDNDFAVYDTNSNKITGDFNNTGVSLSAEYGRKNTLGSGWYIEPQTQFTLGYLGGDNYTTSNGIQVSQSGIKSAVGRIGFNIGKEVGRKGIVYAKANLLHEFGGSYNVTMADSSGQVKVSDAFNDTWLEYGIGAAFKTGQNNHIILISNAVPAATTVKTGSGTQAPAGRSDPLNKNRQCIFIVCFIIDQLDFIFNLFLAPDFDALLTGQNSRIEFRFFDAGAFLSQIIVQSDISVFTQDRNGDQVSDSHQCHEQVSHIPNQGHFSYAAE